MATIYRLSDRLKYQVKDIIVTISPIAFAAKSEIQKLLVQSTQTGDVTLINEAVLKMMKYCIKDIEGVTLMCGSPYVITLDSDGRISDQSVEDLLNMEHSTELASICAHMVRGTGGAVIIDAKGKIIKGVKLITKPAKKMKANDAPK